MLRIPFYVPFKFAYWIVDWFKFKGPERWRKKALRVHGEIELLARGMELPAIAAHIFDKWAIAIYKKCLRKQHDHHS